MYLALLAQGSTETEADVELADPPRVGEVIEVGANRWVVQQVTRLADGTYKALLDCRPVAA